MFLLFCRWLFAQFLNFFHLQIFNDVESIRTILQCMEDIGLDYISLGQMSMNLSSGEAQRIKLAKCLGAIYLRISLDLSKMDAV